MSDEYELDPELKAFVEERLGTPFADETPPPDPDEEDEEEAPEGTEDDAGGEVPEPPESGLEGHTEPDVESGQSGIIEIAPGVAISREQALSFYQFDALLRNRPDLANEINDLVTGKGNQAGAGAPPAPAPAALPPLDEYADENTKAYYAAYEAQQKRMVELQEEIGKLRDVTVTREQEELKSIVAQTTSSFKEEHKLSDEEIRQVTETAERMNVLPSLLSGTDPITGQTGPRDRVTALHRALEIAYWYLPATREKALAAQVQDRAKATRKKQRLAGIAGSSGSMPKEAPAPKTENERRAAMVAEVAQLMNGREE